MFSSWFVDGHLLAVLGWKAVKGTKFSCVSYKGTNPVHKGSILMTNHLPEAPPLHFILPRGGGQAGVLIYMFERDIIHNTGEECS